jgi:hypothetical protein
MPRPNPLPRLFFLPLVILLTSLVGSATPGGTQEPANAVPQIRFESTGAAPS